MIVLGLIAAQVSADDTSDIGIEGEIFRNNEHETLVSGDPWRGVSGDQGLKASVLRNLTPNDRPSTLTTALVVYPDGSLDCDPLRSRACR